MTSTQSTVDFILEQIEDAGIVSARKMFGEYGIYCNGKIVALVCDDKLFVKPTNVGREFIGKCAEVPPYPKAKLYFFIPDEKWHERSWLARLIILTADELPFPKAKQWCVLKSREKLLC